MGGGTPPRETEMAGTLTMDGGPARLPGPRNLTTLAGVGLIAAIGVIHLVEAPEYWGEVHYIGALFVVTAIGAILAAVAIARGDRWGWALGLAIAVGDGAGYVLSRTVGIPRFRENSWETFLEPVGLASLAVEALFVILAVRLMTRWGSNGPR